MTLPAERLKLALVHEVFWDEGGPDDLAAVLARAREEGAELAVLPELALDPWFPADSEERPEDAEPPRGRRHRAFARAARDAGIALLGGAVTIDVESGARRNRALLYDAEGGLVANYDKVHLPSEEGFWESDHYAPGTQVPRRIDALGFPLGLQICSDIQRSAGSHVLAAQQVGAILVPRATPPASYQRWKTVMRAVAITCSCYVISVNRPRPERGVPIGSPSIAIDPLGEVIAETTEELTIVELEHIQVKSARADYPGYLPRPIDFYRRAWSELGEGEVTEGDFSSGGSHA